jgi:hypothetical protein
MTPVASFEQQGTVMSRNRLFAIALTGLTALSVGAPVARAQDCDNGYYAYRRAAYPRLSIGFAVSNRSVYWRRRPVYVSSYRRYPYVRRVVRTYPYRPYRVATRYVAYRRSCY